MNKTNQKTVSTVCNYGNFNSIGNFNNKSKFCNMGNISNYLIKRQSCHHIETSQLIIFSFRYDFIKTLIFCYFLHYVLCSGTLSHLKINKTQ